MPSLLQGFASENSPECQFVKSFVDLPQKGTEERLLFSVCTGALLVAAMGGFGGGLKVTTHMFHDL